MRFVLGLAVFGLSLLAPQMAPAQSTDRIACGPDYFVAPGDTLSQIARRAYGRLERYQQIYAVNVDRIGPDINVIEVGTALRIPCDIEGAQPAGTGAATFEAAPDLAVTAQGVPSNKVDIVFNKASAPGFIINVGIIDPFLADITRATNGRVTFSEPESINRDPEAQLAGVRSGSFDGAYQFNGHLTESHPLLQITMQPMIGGTALQTAIALWRTHTQHFQGADNFDDVKLLGFIGSPPAHIWRVSDAPVTENEQLDGNNAWAVPYFDGLDTKGATAVREENADRIRLLDQTPGLPPATFALAHGAARAVGIWTQARTVTEIDGGVYAPTFSVVISKEKWDQISPADQQAIERLSGETLALRSAAWDAFDNGHKQQMIKEGLTIIQPDFDLLAELQDRARVSWENWIQNADAVGVPGFDAINTFFREMKALRAQYPG